MAGKKSKTATARKASGRKKSARKKAGGKKTGGKKKSGTRSWSAHVTETSNAMDIASGTFAKRSPRAIAREVEHDAEKSTRRKTTPYRSAMSMLTFYINRAGKNLSPERRKILEQAKDVLREEFGPKRTAGRSRKD